METLLKILNLNETEQYRFISDISSNFTDFGTDDKMKEIRQRFDPPCEELHVGTNFRREKGREFRVDDFNQNEMKWKVICLLYSHKPIQGLSSVEIMIISIMILNYSIKEYFI